MRFIPLGPVGRAISELISGQHTERWKKSQVLSSSCRCRCRRVAVARVESRADHLPRSDGLHGRRPRLALGDHHVTIGGQVVDRLLGARGPADRQPIDPGGVSEAEVDAAASANGSCYGGRARGSARVRRRYAVSRAPIPSRLLVVPAERDGQVVGLRELVLEQEDRAAPDLADDEVEPAVVAEVPGDDRSAVAVVVGAGQVADVEEIAAPGRSGTTRFRS